ncbi:hypothetical protein [Bacillus sp. NPDC094106]|uniref:hypothetical protein n=1 Tax=Bacillus sp. NPDC094106 TaxID=3363949 RepID=UPI0038174226
MVANNQKHMKALILTEGEFVNAVENKLIVDGISVRNVLEEGEIVDKLFIPVLPERFRSESTLNKHFAEDVPFVEEEVDGEVGISIKFVEFKKILEQMYSTSLTGKYTPMEFDGFKNSIDALFFEIA